MAKVIMVSEKDFETYFNELIKTLEATAFRKVVYHPEAKHVAEDMFRSYNFHLHEFKKKLES